MTSLTFRVEGRVQGVGFRWFTRTTGIRLDVAGWVQNEDDGSVTGGVVGSPAAVDAFLAAIHTGPPAAIVRRVDTKEADVGPITGFQIRISEGRDRS